MFNRGRQSVDIDGMTLPQIRLKLLQAAPPDCRAQERHRPADVNAIPIIGESRVPETSDWKQKYRDSVLEMEAEEKRWQQIEKVLRRLINRLCAAGMGALCWLALRYSHFDAIEHFATRLVVFIALIGGATLSYLGLAWLLRCSEVHEVYGIAFRRNAVAGGKIGLSG